MSWMAYQVTFRMDSPLHSGFAKIGNIQRTRLYITGRMLWGALTARLTRMLDHQDYQDVGSKVKEYLRTSYFFPSFDREGENVLLPFANLGEVKYRTGDLCLTAGEVERLLLTSYASTAINPKYAAAEDGSLHEIELVSHRALAYIDGFSVKAGAPVYLTGYFFLKKEAPPFIKDNWQAALKQLQIGGERCYGFGHIHPTSDYPTRTVTIFGYTLDLQGTDPKVKIPPKEPAVAHVWYNNNPILSGPFEPFLGRETHADGRFGVQLSNVKICWVPGSRLESTEAKTFKISDFGLWESS